MPDPNVRAGHPSLPERNQEVVSRAAGDGSAMPTPVSTVFGLIETTGVLLSP